MEKCKYCNQTKGHKMSCPTQKIVVNIDNKYCECVFPELRTKCSENGIYSYCLTCVKEIKKHG